MLDDRLWISDYKVTVIQVFIGYIEKKCRQPEWLEDAAHICFLKRTTSWVLIFEPSAQPNGIKMTEDLRWFDYETQAD